MYHHEAAAAGPAATQQQYAVAIMEPYPQPLSRHASSKHSRASSSRSTNNGRGSALAHSQITPPPTPNASQETLVEPVVEQQQQQQQELELELQQQQHQQQLQPAPSPSPPPPPPHPYFHPFLRAFYPFSPTDDISSSTVTLPLREGDVILVHSIHTNGWADGTLLYTGERGWLPTNYCEAYEHEPIRNLLMALLNFWDLLRGGFDTSLAVFTNQEYIRGIIAGVRSLLEKSDCLTRDSPSIQQFDGLRRYRKALLSDLSSLVKTSKRLQDVASGVPSVEHVDDLIDTMILQAFKIVTRGVRFLDIWNDEVGLTQMEEMLDVDTRMDGADDASPLPDHQQHQQQQQQHQHHLHHVVPPTPPAETTSFEHLHHQYRVQYAQEVVVEQPELEEIASRSPAADSNRNSNSNFHCSPFPPPRGLANTTSQIADEPRKLFRQSASYMPTTRPVSFSRRPMSLQIERNSASHRVSYTGRTAAASPSSSLSLANNLASERLSATHDVFLSYLASFIGRLHLQSRSISELLLTTKQSVTSGRDLLAVVDAVCERAQHRAESLEEAKDHMFHRITELVQAAREAVRPPSAHEDSEDVIVADHGRRLMNAATDCVKASGDCVAKTKFVIERIGDFEFEPLGRGLDIPTRLQHVESASEVVEVVEEMEPHGEPEAPMPAEKDLPEEASAASIVVVDVDKPLPLEPPMEHYRRPQPILLIPDAPATNMLADRQHSPTHALFPLLDAPSTSASTIASNRSSITSSLPPLTCLGIPLMDDTTSPKAMSTDSASPQTYGVPDFRTDSIGVASTATSTAYLGSMRDSEATMASQTSTRATTPDAPMAHPLGNQMMAGSQTTLAGDSDEGEANILEKTFAHELLFNKDGQITGGTLPALIERLTTHHSTPDSTFVSTFYLTFRLFATPADFATTLIERFDYVAESPHIAAPVRLRVYNVFKGWLESHWRPECDEPSLEIIQTFARGKLQLVLPSAGRRLSELAEKVSSVHGPLVPRLVSSIGKTSTSIAQYISPDTPMPAPILSKSQLNSLKSWKLGSNPNLCILDFDPLELARQFTLKESRIFCSILPEELLDSEWMKKSGSMAFNVRAMSTLSTDLANLVIDNILLLEEAKKRAAVIKQWVKIASKCLELNNYDSLMAIICSLNCSTILRLKKTWEAVSAKTKAKLENLKVIVDVSRNYHVLRQRLQNHVPPCLPFVGTYLTDLTFVDIGNPTHRKLPANGIHDGITVINFDKHMKTAKIIGELQRFQIPYRLNEIPEMQEWMQAQIVRVRSSDDTNVQNYYRRSLLLEPRESETPSQSQRPSPVEALYFNYTSTTSPSSATTKEASSARDKFDFLSWTGHARDKSLTTPS